MQHFGFTSRHITASIEDVADSIVRTGHSPFEHLEHTGVLGPNVVLSHIVHIDAGKIQIIKNTIAL